MNLRNFNRDLARISRAGELHPAFDDIGFALSQLNRIILDKRGRHFHQLHSAGQAAVVPEIRFQRGHSVCVARVIDFHYKAVVPVIKLIGGVEIERGKSANVFAELFTIQPRPSKVVGRTEIKKRPNSSLLVIRKASLIPQWAFIEEQRFPLGVPISGDVQLRRVFEIVLNQVAFCFGLGVLVEAASEASFVGIDNCVPVPIEADRGTAAHISDCSLESALRMYADACQQHRRQQRLPHLASSSS